MSRSIRLFGVLLGAALCSLALAGPALADYVVDDLDDVAVGAADGVCDAPGGDSCTLREAILEANATAGLDTITFSVNGTINTSGVGTLGWIEPIVIDGNGPTNTIIDGNDAIRVFFANASSQTFKDMRIEDGLDTNPTGGGGAAIRSSDSVTLDNVVVTSSQETGTGPGHGAGIFMSSASGSVSLVNSTVSDNTISSTLGNTGAGISSLGSVSLTDSTVSGNMITAGTAEGGGIRVDQGFSVVRSTISGNSTSVPGQGGGGLYDGGSPGTRTILNSTISGNTGFSSAGGVSLDASTAITNTTFASNSDTSLTANDILAFGGATVTVTLKNTILGSGSPTTAACSAIGGATVTSPNPGNNIDSNQSPNCGLGAMNGNRQNTDPLLGPLALNSPGTTKTHALMTGSPAIDTALADCGGLTNDQRGVTRPQPTGGICDVGSFELEQATRPPSGGGTTPLTPVAPTAQPTATPNPLCAGLRKKLKKAKSKKAKSKIRKKLRQLGC